MATIEALEKLMQIYPGTILFTSHDSYFVERTADEVYEIKGQKIKVLTRNFKCATMIFVTNLKEWYRLPTNKRRNNFTTMMCFDGLGDERV